MRVHQADYSAAHKAFMELCAPFFQNDFQTLQAEPVDPNQIPPPFYGLLVHEQHMTTTLQTFYGQPIALQVLDEFQMGSQYGRKIMLTLTNSKYLVEFGIALVDFRFVSTEVRGEILAHQKPLGDILIRHNVLRRIEPRWYFRFPGDSAITSYFEGLEVPAVYGRLGEILCDGQPAIHVLEVVSGINP